MRYLLILALLLTAPTLQAGWPTEGGEGGREIVVTSLAEAGPGSLKEALETGGPAVIKFAVGGEIWLSDTLVIGKPFLTIAGETAPEPGITLMGDRVRIRSHDVILRHLRIKVGARKTGSNPSNRDALEVEGSADGKEPSHHVLVENCSFQWAVDETAQSWNREGHDIVFRRCLIAEGLRNSIHPKGARSIGLVIGPEVKNVLVQENLFISNTYKNVGIWGGSSAVIVNNVIYNPVWGGVQFYPTPARLPLSVAVIGNVVIAGPDTQPALKMFDAEGLNPGSQIYLHENRAEGTATFDSQERPAGWVEEAPKPFVDASPIVLPEMTAIPTGEVVERVTAQAGARPWNRDANDALLIQEFQSREGSIKDLPADPRLLPQ